MTQSNGIVFRVIDPKNHSNIRGATFYAFDKTLRFEIPSPFLNVKNFCNGFYAIF